jgi:hypothetical protein
MSMRRGFSRAAALVSAVLVGTVVPAAGVASPVTRSTAYDRQVLRDKPCAYYNAASATRWTDQVTGAQAIFAPSGHAWASLGGFPVPVFNGRDQFARMADRPCFSVSGSGALTLQAWIRPDTTLFARTEESGYVWWAGKGERSGPFGDREWAMRMYSADNTEDRVNRISGYVFGKAGGLGAGSAFQDPITIGQWIHYTFVINWGVRSEQYPLGYTRVYRDGVLRQTSSIAAYPNVVPADGKAPVRIGTRDGKSFFAGAIAKFAVYPYELSADRVAAQALAMQ